MCEAGTGQQVTQLLDSYVMMVVVVVVVMMMMRRRRE
jgi:hypothetical protein